MALCVALKMQHYDSHTRVIYWSCQDYAGQCLCDEVDKGGEEGLRCRLRHDRSMCCVSNSS